MPAFAPTSTNGGCPCDQRAIPSQRTQNAVDSARSTNLSHQESEVPRPAPNVDCPATFGNTDIFGGSWADPTPELVTATTALAASPQPNASGGDSDADGRKVKARGKSDGKRRKGQERVARLATGNGEGRLAALLLSGLTDVTNNVPSGAPLLLLEGRSQAFGYVTPSLAQAS
jgi:hypothetical protein